MMTKQHSCRIMIGLSSIINHHQWLAMVNSLQMQISLLFAVDFMSRAESIPNRLSPVAHFGTKHAYPVAGSWLRTLQPLKTHGESWILFKCY